MSNKTINTLVVAALIFAICSLTIAYAAFERILNISTETVTQSNQTTWKVEFINQDSGSQTGNADKGNISLNSTDISIRDVVLRTAGDKVEYNFYVDNSGQLDAILTIITPKVPVFSGSNVIDEQNIESGFNYSLSYADGTEVKIGDILDSKKQNQLKITMFLDDDTVLPVSGDVNITNLGYTLVYTQK